MSTIYRLSYVNSHSTMNGRQLIYDCMDYYVGDKVANLMVKAPICVSQIIS
jgi:hypothetical protein